MLAMTPFAINCFMMSIVPAWMRSARSRTLMLAVISRALAPSSLIKQLMANGVLASINQQIDYDTAAIVIGEFGFEARPVAVPEPAADEQGPAGPSWRQWISDENPADLVERPPVVTILGHV